MALNERQQRFVDAYLKTPNATEAAIQAGYSEATAKQIGSRLLTHVDVAAALASARSQATERAIVTVSEVLKGLRDEARYFGEGATHGARVTAWKALGDHLGLFKDQTKATETSQAHAEALRKLRERAD